MHRASFLNILLLYKKIPIHHSFITTRISPIKEKINVNKYVVFEQEFELVPNTSLEQKTYAENMSIKGNDKS